MLGTEAPVVPLGLGDPQVLKDPQPKLREIRETAQVVYDPALERWMIGRDADVRAVLRDQAAWATDTEFLINLFGARPFEAMDFDQHKRIRGVFNPPFGRRAVESEQRPMVEELVSEHLEEVFERLSDGEVVDMVPTIARVIPAKTIGAMLGVQDDDIEQFADWADGIGKVVEALTEADPDRRAELNREGMEASAKVCAYAGAQLEQRRRSSSADDDLFGRVAASEIASEELTEDERRASLAQLVFGAQDTTAKSMAHLLVTLARFPDQRRAIVEDRSLIPDAIEELLRWESVTPVNPRIARDDVQIGDVTIPAGGGVFCMQGSANRDPAKHPDPDKFDVLRKPNLHVSFGFGVHKCIGLDLARMEMRALFERLLDRFPEYQLADDLESIEYGPNFMMRGPLTVNIAA